MVSAPTNLPAGNCPTLGLVHPTAEEKLAQFKANGVEWRGALSLETYLRREEVLANQNQTKNGGITYWALVDTAAEKRVVLCGCETYRKKALVARNGKVEETISHGIGSVFCPPAMRGNRYAQRMMQEVGKALRTWQTGDKESLFSVLYSDIGKSFYSRLGWEPFNSAHISVPARTAKELPTDGLPTTRPLYEKDLAELCRIDEAIIRKTLESRSSNSKIAVALVPDINTIQWHHAREDFVGNELHGKSPEIKGAIVGTEEGKRIWTIWTRMWYNNDPTASENNTLHILRLVIEEQGELSLESQGAHNPTNGSNSTPKHAAAVAALLLMAQEEARKWNMAELEAWNPSPAMVFAAQMLDPDAEVVNRDKESIASLKWNLPHEHPVADSIDWIGNEKYGWC
ncbi:uncharacterized protein BDZ99DRAFT_438365 [Mytilinidion resinicola]|uniref:LYC1 C-terminal domain-containing protein n=1 Tax=Mytilinidion resinicola TaxID=574789 RepID=A0A6A6YZ71_9PEZI|nr:uncharacterized protein BDZ99DRAFT_438365 [Mytilinidion resinicola]KAF2813304.1 hypothetical protein BDZ99DRAFT_438365 [Mytilinidion resinicola]